MDLNIAKKYAGRAKRSDAVQARTAEVGDERKDERFTVDLGACSRATRAFRIGACRAVSDAAYCRAVHYGFDAGSAQTARVMVEQTLADLFRHEYPEAKFTRGGLIAIDQSLHPGTEEYGYNELEAVGEAKLISPSATDIPLATIKTGRTKHTVQSGAIGFTWDRQEIRAADLQNQYSLAQEKGAAAREALDQLLDRLIPFGDADAELLGLLRAPGIMVRVAGSDWLNPATTADTIHQQFSGAVTAQGLLTKERELPNTAVMPFSIMRALQERYRENTDKTAMDMIRKDHPFITRWETSHQMEEAGFDGAPAIAIYRNERSRVRAQMPLGYTPVPEQVEGFVSKVAIEFRWGGVNLPRPKSVMLLQGITA